MQPRSDLVDLFSTFLQFDQDYTTTWVTDPGLRRRMQRCIVAIHNSSTEDINCSQTLAQVWVLYWHRRWHQQAERQSLAHLSAYLQETCYWAADRIRRQYPSRTLQLSDYFQIAIADLAKILHRYNPSHQAGLSAYASVAFSNTLRDTLRQQREIDLCSDWGLLLKLSRKRVQLTLEEQGLTVPSIQARLLAWQCLTEHYSPVTPRINRLSAPTEEIWQAIAQAYNRQRRTLITDAEPERHPQELEQWLLEVARLVRVSLYPAVVSLNQPQGTTSRTDWEPQLLNGESVSPLELAMLQEAAQEREQQRSQINQLLLGAIAQLAADSQELVDLYYGQSFTQQQIASRLGLQQYAVSRKLARVRETLLAALANWSQEQLHISPTSIVMKSMSMMLEEWLQAHYQPSATQGESDQEF